MTDTLTIFVPYRQLTVADAMAQQIAFEFFELNEKGATFKPETPENVWGELMVASFTAHDTLEEKLALVKTRIADGCNFGEAVYGERWSQVLPAIRAHYGITEKKLSTLMWIFRNVAPERRRLHTLTITHLEIVAKLTPEEQEKWLSKAEKEEWTTQTLKDEVKAVHGKPRVTAPSHDPEDEDEEEVTEGQANEALATATRFFRQMEKAHGSSQNWSGREKDKWKPVLKKLAGVARRLNAKSKPVTAPEEPVEA